MYIYIYIYIYMLTYIYNQHLVGVSRRRRRALHRAAS